MKSEIPKQFHPLAGKPVIYYTISAFLRASAEMNIILVLPEQELAREAEIKQYFPADADRIHAVAGGDTRFHSVQNGLRAAPQEDGLLLVHDGARPFPGIRLIRDCLLQAAESGSAVPLLPLTDSIRQWDGETFRAIDRSHLRALQTPQVFRSDILQPAYRQPYREAFTDEATVVEAAGGRIHFVEGARSNIKITTPEDLLWAAFYIENNRADEI